jgi:hypothetical protein
MQEETLKHIENWLSNRDFLVGRKAGIEAELKATEDQIEEIDMVKLPDLFGDIRGVKLADGREITIDNDFYPSIKAESWDKAKEWFASNGLDGIIKNEFKVSFGKMELTEADELKAILLDRKHKFKNKEFVEPMTLKALVKERYGTGIEDTETSGIGVFVKRIAKIKKG